MSSLESPEHGKTFDLDAIERELRQEEPYRRDGQAARTLVHTPDLRVVLVALASGRHMAEHHANVTASVQALSGKVRLQLPDRTVELLAGNVLVMGSGLRHDVEAEADSAILLTLGWDEPS